MKRIYFLLLLCLCGPELLRAQVGFQKFPSYETVVRKAFNTYDLESLKIKGEIRFEKRKTGWFISINEHGEREKKIYSFLFWDAHKQKYQKLPLGKAKDKAAANNSIIDYLGRWMSSNYNICPYYGYIGWDWDVADEFKEAGNFPDSIVYGIGRAYSSCASSLLNNNSGYALAERSFQLGSGQNTMNAEQLARYRYYRHKAIALFSQADSMNPGLQTLVGEIAVKRDNEHVVAYLELLVYQNEAEAMKELPDKLYSALYLETAKNYLKSCEPNAILITHGDNDTYPLLYVQAKLGFRKDVLVMNSSLLNTSRYVNYLRKPAGGIKGLKTRFTEEDIANGKRDLILLMQQSEEYEDLVDWIDFVKTDGNFHPDYKPKEYYYGRTDKWYLKVGSDSMHWRLNNYYLFLGQLVLLDEISAELGKRPICFAITLGDDEYLGLNKYLQMEGLVYHLGTSEKELSEALPMFVNSDIMYQKLMDEFLYPPLKQEIFIHYLLVTNYRNCFGKLITRLMEEGKNDSAYRVAKKYLSIYPNEQFLFSYELLPFIEICYQMGDVELANKVTFTLLENHRKHLLEKEFFPSDPLVVKYTIGMLKGYAEKYKQSELLQKLNSL